MEDTVELGGNIQLTGFSNVDGASMIILKKIVGNYAKKFSEKSSGFRKLKIIMNSEEGYNFNAEVVTEGNSIIAETKDNNLFFALDSALKEIESKL